MIGKSLSRGLWRTADNSRCTNGIARQPLPESRLSCRESMNLGDVFIFKSRPLPEWFLKYLSNLHWLSLDFCPGSLLLLVPTRLRAHPSLASSRNWTVTITASPSLAATFCLEALLTSLLSFSHPTSLLRPSHRYCYILFHAYLGNHDSKGARPFRAERIHDEGVARYEQGPAASVKSPRNHLRSLISDR